MLPSHRNLKLSPRLDFEATLRTKDNFVEVLREELVQPGYIVSPIDEPCVHRSAPGA